MGFVGRVALVVAAALACGGARSGVRGEAAGPSGSGGAASVCGRLPGQPVVAKTWQYASVAGPSAECDRAETTWANVPHEDRACRVDLDCGAVLDPSGCSYRGLTRDAAMRPEYAPVGCGHPAAGACVQQTPVARCVAGCCEAQLVLGP